MQIDGKQVNTDTVQITNIVMADYPDFCDAYFCAADFADGTPLTDAQIDTLNETYADRVNGMIHERVLFV